MTPGTFNRKRFAALCRLDWAEKQKSYLLFLLLSYAVTTLIITYNSLRIYYDMSLIGDYLATVVPLPPGADRSWDRHLAYLVVFFFVFMLLATRQTHTGMLTRRQCTAALLRPASHGEKFVRWWCYAVPLSMVAFALVYLAADYTRILVCRMLFSAPEPLAIPLYKGIGWYFDSETRLIFQMLLTITLLGQSVLALTMTLKKAYARIFARFILVALPFIFGYSFSSLIRVYPTAMDIACLWLGAWHIFFLGLTVACWYATCRRLPRMDIEYSYPPKFDKA